MNNHTQLTTAIVCQVRAIGRFALNNNIDRLPIRAALRDVLVELEPRREPLQVVKVGENSPPAEIGGAA
jgi:hypothetical protein